jgi:hypothetical protein
MTLRETARVLVIEEVAPRAEYEHQRNYHKLHINRDGTIGWSECINKSDDLIDSRADHFAPIPSVACVGTGSFACNCDFCNEVYNEADEQHAKDAGREYDRANKYESESDAIMDAVCESDLSYLEADMLADFDRIPIGYFDDEETVVGL